MHNDFFEEIAKFRAARRMWARIMRERFGAKNPRSWLLRTHAQTAGVSLMAQQPLNNVVRTTLQALAAVLGGTQSLHTNSFDETYALPTEEAATLALRTQQIIAEESGVAAVADPLGGSYFVESLTDQMEAEAHGATSSKIDGMGGIVRAVEEGYPQREIADVRLRVPARRSTAASARSSASTSTSPTSTSADPDAEDRSSTPEREQVARVQALRARAATPAARARGSTACAAPVSGDDNVMDAVLEAVKTRRDSRRDLPGLPRRVRRVPRSRGRVEGPREGPK